MDVGGNHDMGLSSPGMGGRGGGAQRAMTMSNPSAETISGVARVLSCTSMRPLLHLMDQVVLEVPQRPLEVGQSRRDRSAPPS